jgi:hypothetical protein
LYDDRTLQIIEYHRSMLIDEVRTTSFLRAILGAIPVFVAALVGFLVVQGMGLIKPPQPKKKGSEAG